MLYLKTAHVCAAYACLGAVSIAMAKNLSENIQRAHQTTRLGGVSIPAKPRFVAIQQF
jgi:hypothetical protein